MRSAALEPRTNTVVPAVPAASPAPPVLAQRASTLGASGPVAAPPIRDAGRPLPADTRAAMESSFGRDFGGIRVHDDARAHDDARSLASRAYTAGDHIVFAEGAFRPDTPRGDALIAHELAHTVQQGGVQTKLDGSVSAVADAELERQADRAASDATSGRSVSSLGRIGRPAVFRAVDDPAPGGSAKPPIASATQKLPPGMTAITDDPPGAGTTELVVNVDSFTLPSEKGLGPWVKTAYDQAATGGRLVFSPLIEGGRVAAYKEGGEDYKSIWLGKYGFASTHDLATAFRSAAAANDNVKTAMADKSVKALVTGMSKNLMSSGCDIDHIVEKQMGGTSIPSNLQLLDSKKNQASGRDAYRDLVKLVDAIRNPSMRGPAVRKLQLRIQKVELAQATNDASFVVEDLLRKGAVAGSAALKAKAEGEPILLTAGGVGESVNVRDNGRTPIDSMAKRIVPGMRLVGYTRGHGGRKSKADKIEGELDSRAITKSGAAKADVTLTAEPAPAAGGPAPGGAAATPATDAPSEETTPATEHRVLKMSSADKKARIGFYYPYLSPGHLDHVDIDDTGRLFGTGIIKPSVPFLGDLHIKYGPGDNALDMVAPIPASKLKAPIPGFRFTGGELSASLFPAFVPKGNLTFQIGPEAKPIILGTLDAKYEAGAFIATGKLKPGTRVPGIKDAAGEVVYNSDTGWAGSLTASSSSIPGASIDAVLGFRSGKGGAFDAYGTGQLSTEIKGKPLHLKVRWRGGAIAYYGDVEIPKPLPLVEKVKLDGAYEDELLYLKGDAQMKWRTFSGTATVMYRRRDGEPGRFSGSAEVVVKTDKADGLVHLTLKESGKVTGTGKLKYWITKNIAPELGVEYGDDERLKVFGSVTVSKITLIERWPKGGGHITFLKGGLKFSFPTPIPAVTGFAEIHAEAFLEYGVGPATVDGLILAAELYPFEDDPKIKATLDGGFTIPADVTLGGKVGASIGAEVAWGAVGAKGTLDVVPKLQILAKIYGNAHAEYSAAGFSFQAAALAEGKLKGSVDLVLSVTLSAVWGLLTHEWPWTIGGLEATMDPGLTIQLGKFKYGPEGGAIEPDVKPVPEDLDTESFLRGLLQKAKDKDKKVEPPKSLEAADAREAAYHGHMI